MIYCYRCTQCDDVFEEDFPMGEAAEGVDCPSCTGHALRSYADEGNKVNSGAINASNQYPYTSLRLPRNLPGCPTNEKGQPIITSKKHEREIMARHNYSRD